MHIVIDGEAVKSVGDFHTILARELSLTYYGRNLDAMWDALTADWESPICLVWKKSRASSEALGEKFGQIVDVLERIKEQDEALGMPETFQFHLE